MICGKTSRSCVHYKSSVRDHGFLEIVATYKTCCSRSAKSYALAAEAGTPSAAAEILVFHVALLTGSAAVNQLPHAVLANGTLTLPGALAESILTAPRSSSIGESRVDLDNNGRVDSIRRRAHVLALGLVELAEGWRKGFWAHVLALSRVKGAERDLWSRHSDDGDDESSQGDNNGRLLHVERRRCGQVTMGRSSICGEMKEGD